MEKLYPSIRKMKKHYDTKWKKLQCGQCETSFKTILFYNQPWLFECVGGEYICVNCVKGHSWNNVACEEHWNDLYCEDCNFNEERGSEYYELDLITDFIKERTGWKEEESNE